jgi:uncharacterized protein
MAIKDMQDWSMSEKGRKDAERHRGKVEESIKKQIKDVIADESIIGTSRDGRTVKVPIKGLKDYRFKHGFGKGDGRGGAGQGDGKAGDVLGRRKKNGKGGQNGPPGPAGNQPGEDIIETEVTIDYLIDLMCEDLGLPYLEEKDKAEQLIPKGWKFDTISKIGVPSRLHKKKTLHEAILRQAVCVKELMDNTGCEMDDAYRALTQGRGEITEALAVIMEGRLDKSIEPQVFIQDEDLRYKQIEEDVEVVSNAVVIAMMDTSGSMYPEKKYLARAYLFWMVEFLKKTYKNVQIKFIAHHTEAKVVDEETFFRKGESGGTMCHTAFDLANHIIDTEFPVSEWNVYCVYSSDGEDFDMKHTEASIRLMLAKKIAMLGYIEVDPDGGPTWYTAPDGNLMEYLRKKFKFDMTSEAGMNLFKNEEEHFLACTMTKKEHVFTALKHFLFKKNGGM